MATTWRPESTSTQSPNARNNPKAWRNLALVYGRLGLYETALETFLQVEAERDAYNETGAIAMSNGDYQDALHYLNEAVRVSPTYFAQAEKNIAEIRKTDPTLR